MTTKSASSSRDRKDAKSSTRIEPEKYIAARASAPVALIDMTVPQMAAAISGLDRLETQYENMSGICATLKGLVLIEAKRKLGRGDWMPWVKKHFPAKHKTANRYMRLAEAFMGKLDSTVQFQTLTRDLADSVAALREFQLDLSHPVVAKVAQWVAGRGAYQLMLDFPGERGGHHPRKGPPKDYDPNAPGEIARDLWEPHLSFLERDGLEQRTWMDLPKAELNRLRDIALDLNRALKSGSDRREAK